MIQVRNITVKNLRCFNNFSFDVKAPVVLIKGANGSGKTTLLEALAYASNLKSFRTHHAAELVSFTEDGFFIKLQVEPDHVLKTAFAGGKRLIKFDEKAIRSYKEIANLYHAVCLTEDDLDIVQAGPDLRRTFVDQVLSITDPEYIQDLKNNKRVVDQRTALLNKPTFSDSYYQFWTDELKKKSSVIKEKRVDCLKVITQRVNELFNSYINPVLNKNYIVELRYQEKFELVKTENKYELEQLMHKERRSGRTLFGAQLDDIVINLQEQKSRSFASRGQQKLLVLILKIVSLMLILESSQKPDMLIFLLDDFLTDLDSRVAHALLKLISDLNVQLFITSPGTTNVVEEALTKENIDYQEILL